MPGRGQADALAAAQQQRGAQMFLQIRQSFADGGGGGVTAGGGLGDTARIDDCQEKLQIP